MHLLERHKRLRFTKYKTNANFATFNLSTFRKTTDIIVSKLLHIIYTLFFGDMSMFKIKHLKAPYEPLH